MGRTMRWSIRAVVCLEIRGYAETEPALRNLVEAARQVRATVAG
jgi:hypothetical protein